jgi:clan AA aspartic protease (TIGR02281 family)
MLPLVLALAACVPARADVVYLKNGNQLEGVITERKGSKITVDIGYGSTVLDREDIAKIERSDKSQAAKTAVKLKRRQYESGLTVPKGGERLDGLYRDAQAKREKALDARTLSRELDDEFTQLEDGLPALKADYASASSDLGRADAGSDPRGYNRRVGEVNKTGVRIQAAGLRLGEIERLKKEAGLQKHDYLESHRRLEEYVRGEGAGLLKQDAGYYAWLRDEIAAMTGDFRQDEVSAEKSREGVFVKVLLNGKVTARLLVDTGASTTLLYRETVDRLGLAPEKRVGTAEVKVADGRTVSADVLRLDSMSVGRSEVKSVLVAASPASGQGFDGLLGMTFLGQFVVRVDAAHGRLILEDLK